MDARGSRKRGRGEAERTAHGSSWTRGGAEEGESLTPAARPRDRRREGDASGRRERGGRGGGAAWTSAPEEEDPAPRLNSRQRRAQAWKLRRRGEDAFDGESGFDGEDGFGVEGDWDGAADGTERPAGATRRAEKPVERSAASLARAAKPPARRGRGCGRGQALEKGEPAFADKHASWQLRLRRRAAEQKLIRKDLRDVGVGEIVDVREA